MAQLVRLAAAVLLLPSAGAAPYTMLVCDEANECNVDHCSSQPYNYWWYVKLLRTLSLVVVNFLLCDNIFQDILNSTDNKPS